MDLYILACEWNIFSYLPKKSNFNKVVFKVATSVVEQPVHKSQKATVFRKNYAMVNLKFTPIRTKLSLSPSLSPNSFSLADFSFNANFQLKSLLAFLNAQGTQVTRWQSSEVGLHNTEVVFTLADLLTSSPRFGSRHSFEFFLKELFFWNFLTLLS